MRDAEDGSGKQWYQRRQWAVHEADGEDEEMVGVVNAVVEVGRLRPLLHASCQLDLSEGRVGWAYLADLSGSATEQASADPGGDEGDNLSQIEERRGTAQRKDREPVRALDEVRVEPA